MHLDRSHLSTWIIAAALAVGAWPGLPGAMGPAMAPLSAQAAPADAALLPADGFDGWTKSGKPRVYTKADLYGRIDGGAEVFLEIGFEQLLVQSYRKPGAASQPGSEFVIEIYRMTDATAARGMYVSKCGKETRDPSFRERHTVNRYQLMFQRGRYFVIIGNNGGRELLQPALVTFGAALATKMPPDSPVPALALLPKPNLVAGSERLIRGGFGLQGVFTLGDGDMLRLGGTLTAVAGDYAVPGQPPTTLIVAEYANPAAARAALQYVQGHLDRYLTVVSKGDARLVFQDFEKKYGVATVTGRRLEVRLHLAKAPAIPVP